MPTKVYLLKGEIVKLERVEYDEVRYVDIDLNDGPTLQNNEIIKFEGSDAHKKQLADYEATQGEGVVYTVNITTEKKKKHAVVHVWTDVDFDEARGDLRTTNPQEAQAYADKVNSKK